MPFHPDITQSGSQGLCRPPVRCRWGTSVQEVSRAGQGLGQGREGWRLLFRLVHAGCTSRIVSSRESY